MICCSILTEPRPACGHRNLVPPACPTSGRCSGGSCSTMSRGCSSLEALPSLRGRATTPRTQESSRKSGVLKFLKCFKGLHSRTRIASTSSDLSVWMKRALAFERRRAGCAHAQSLRHNPPAVQSAGTSVTKKCDEVDLARQLVEKPISIAASRHCAARGENPRAPLHRDVPSAGTGSFSCELREANW